MISSVEKYYDQNNNFIAYTVVYNDGSTWSVPLDSSNSDYISIQEWVAEGNTITDNGGD